jgi:natural product precursor
VLPVNEVTRLYKARRFKSSMFNFISMKSLRKMGLKEHSTLSNKQMKQVIGGYVTNCSGSQAGTICTLDENETHFGRCTSREYGGGLYCAYSPTV